MIKKKGTLLGICIVLLAGFFGFFIPSSLFDLTVEGMKMEKKIIPFRSNQVEENMLDKDIKESEYKKIIRSIYSKDETYYHEPLNGQLNMTQAVDLAIDATNEIFGDLLSNEELTIDNFITISAVLESKKKDYMENPEYSYWDVVLSNGSEEIKYWINSVTGRLLYVEVGLFLLNDLDDVDSHQVMSQFVDYTGYQIDKENYQENEGYYNNFSEQVYKGEYMNCTVGKYVCMSPNYMDYQYIMVTIKFDE